MKIHKMSNAMNMNTSNLPLHEGLPLQGIQVVDFGCYLAGPLVGRHLADAGATVISIQPPSGPLYKNIPVNHMLNRGKKIIQIDLKTKEGQRHAWELVLQADVLIENFSNGTMAKFGLSSDAVKRSNPKIIYLSLPGFASCDEEFAEMKHYEAIIMAQCGVYCDMGLNRTLMGINPSYSPLPLASTYGSIVGALGIVLGLIGREGKNGNDSGDGDGDIMEVPLGAALCDALVFNSMDIPSLPPRYLTIRELEIATNRKLGKKMDYNYRQVKELLDPFYHTYICKDRRPFYIVAPCHAGHQTRALKALGIWEDMVALGLPTEEGDVYAESNTWNKNSGSGSGSGNGMNMVLGTYPLTDPVWIVRFKEAMKKAFLKKTAKEWEVIFMGYKVTGAATMTSKEWLHSEHANASGLVIERYNPMLKCMQKEAGPVVWQKRSICPTSKVMREQCQAKAMSNFVNLKKKDLWLTGTKVVDLANVIAGPTSGGMLARYGADVLKCDPTKPTYDALVAVYMGCPINTGKKSLLVNIKKSKNGKDILKRLIEWADVW
jgi:crotonobetainyl-CoA:carnitine CoA-transferase CaiB-like acyl-CoA transferase